MEAKRKRWLDRSGSLRLGKTKSLNPSAVSNSSSNASNLTQTNYASSPWSSPESERRSFHIRNRSVDRALDEDDPGKVKGFVNRYSKHETTIILDRFVTRLAPTPREELIETGDF